MTKVISQRQGFLRGVKESPMEVNSPKKRAAPPSPQDHHPPIGHASLPSTPTADRCPGTTSSTDTETTSFSNYRQKSSQTKFLHYWEAGANPVATNRCILQRLFRNKCIGHCHTPLPAARQRCGPAPESDISFTHICGGESGLKSVSARRLRLAPRARRTHRRLAFGLPENLFASGYLHLVREAD